MVFLCGSFVFLLCFISHGRERAVGPGRKGNYHRNGSLGGAYPERLPVGRFAFVIHRPAVLREVALVCRGERVNRKIGIPSDRFPFHHVPRARRKILRRNDIRRNNRDLKHNVFLNDQARGKTFRQRSALHKINGGRSVRFEINFPARCLSDICIALLTREQRLEESRIPTEADDRYGNQKNYERGTFEKIACFCFVHLTYNLQLTTYNFYCTKYPIITWVLPSCIPAVKLTSTPALRAYKPYTPSSDSYTISQVLSVKYFLYWPCKAAGLISDIKTAVCWFTLAS